MSQEYQSKTTIILVQGIVEGSEEEQWSLHGEPRRLSGVGHGAGEDPLREVGLPLTIPVL